MKKKIFSAAVIALSLFAVSCGNNNQTSSADTAKANSGNGASGNNATVSASANAGQDLYSQKCTVCHGNDGKAGVMGAADLAASKSDHATIVSTIKNGKNQMKAFSGELTDDQINAVATYVESLRK